MLGFFSQKGGIIVHGKPKAVRLATTENIFPGMSVGGASFCEMLTGYRSQTKKGKVLTLTFPSIVDNVFI